MLQYKLIAAALIGLSILGVSTLAHAALPGFYVEGDAGYANTHFPSPLNSTGIAGRATVGYQFDQNFGAELGYTHLSNAAPTSVSEYAIDAMVKGILPLGNCFNIFGKAGGAYAHASANNINKSNILPAFGVGVGYDFTPNVPVSIGWNRIQKIGSSDLNSADFFYAGVAYHFG